MGKQIKLATVLSTAVLLTIDAPVTSSATQGWTEEDSTWVHLDKDSYKVTDSQKKSGDL